MKTFGIVALVALCVVSTAISQISLTMTDYATSLAPGKTWRTLAPDGSATVSMNVGTASTTQPQTWIVPTIAFVDTFRYENLLPSGTPYFSYFPRATHSQRIVVKTPASQLTSYGYYRLASDSLIHLGGAGRIIAPGYDTTSISVKSSLNALFPVRIGSTLSWRDSTELGSGYLITRGTETVDAFGTLVTSFGTFQCLRMREIAIGDARIPGFPIPPDTTISYTWITREGVVLNASLADGAPTSGMTTLEFPTLQTVITTPVNVSDVAQPPTAFQLFQNYPNPFNPTTSICFQLSTASFATLKVFDVLGREVATLVNDVRPAGAHVVRWDGSSSPSGVYVYRLSAGEVATQSRAHSVETRTMILLR